ncbi:MAG: DR2241 family protein [Verrucomicrobiales bacterium]
MTHALASWLRRGGNRLGELIIQGIDDGWEARHIADAEIPPSTLTSYNRAEAAREIAKYDAAGDFRPLKAAPTLIRGWRLVVPDVSALREALDFFYPAALGNWVAFTADRAVPVPLKETFARQTGMYRITGLLTDDDCRAVVATTCDFATCCRRRITWPVSPGHPLTTLPPEKTDTNPDKDELPILCLEACNFLVAAARSYIKVKRATAE